MILYRQAVLDRDEGWVVSWHPSYVKADEWRRKFARERKDSYITFRSSQGFDIPRDNKSIIAFLNQLEEERAHEGVTG